MDIEYHAFGTINRTVSVLPFRWREPEPFWGRDLQQLPPPGWCEKCGKEVYRRAEALCEECIGRNKNDGFEQEVFDYGLEERSGG